MSKFTLNINLDNEIECHEFIKKYGNSSKRSLANQLGFVGKGAAKAAQALNNYAWNKKTATMLRKMGEIDRAIVYEKICDDIYKEDIEPNIECW